MTLIAPHTQETAPQGSKEWLEKIAGQYGFVPNMMAVLAESPAALDAYMKIYGALSAASLSPADQHLVMIAVSAVNGCDYCVPAHSTVAPSVGLAEDVIEALRSGTPIQDEKREALRQFAQKMARQSGQVAKADVDAFLAAGYGTADLLDVIVCLSLKTISNFTNHVSDVPLDEQFAARAWTKDQVAAA